MGVMYYLELLFFVSPHSNGADRSIFLKIFFQTSLKRGILITETFLLGNLAKA